MDLIKQNKKSKKIRLGMSDRMFDIVVTSIVTVFIISILYPLIYVVSSSFSSGIAVSEGRVLLWPVEFTIAGYQTVFNNQSVWLGYANTIFYTVGKTILGLIYGILVAYVLSRKTFQAWGFCSILVIIPMWFHGGMIPNYILVSDLGMNNNRWGYIFMTTFSVTNMILLRTYFQTAVPAELLESAKMDGISDIGYLFKIVLPLSKPVISVVTLYEMVAEWNNYMGPMIYLRPKNLWPLQITLRRILEASRMDLTMVTNQDMLNEMLLVGDSMKYALIVVSTVPILCLFPFVQKFFDKGVMMGALKG